MEGLVAKLAKMSPFPDEGNNNSTPPRLLVAAIDFGTTFSSWAFSFKHDYESDPTRISSKQWIGGQHVSLKAPTTVLIKPDGQTLEAFGYEAENKYADLAVDHKHSTYYYYKHFKMTLFKKGLSRNMTLEDDKGLSLPAKTVFSLAIRYLKDDLMKTSSSQLADRLKEGEIHWVLTVPAIWNDAAKQFMRESAVQAGILSENLTIALEPEAASLFCRLMPVQKSGREQGNISTFGPGSRYMILDAGGGTVDVTVHEVIYGSRLKELHKASGGAWGGTKVDESFYQMLAEIFTKDVLQKFQKNYPDDYLDIFRDFDVKKKDIAPDKDAKITLKIPCSLKDLHKEETKTDLQTAIGQSSLADDVTLVGDKLRISASVYKNMFKEAIDSIVRHVESLLREPSTSGCQAILMVGGFGESVMLQGAIRSNFPNLKLVVPYQSGLVVVKGAVVFGHNPSSIDERVCKYTYGIETSKEFIEGKHDQKKKIMKGGKWYCKDLFDEHVQAGQTVKFGETQTQRNYKPVTEDQTSISFNVYATKRAKLKYVTEDGCTKLGGVTISDINRSVPLNSRSVKVAFTFSGTEVEVLAREEKTGKISRCQVNFLD